MPPRSSNVKYEDVALAVQKVESKGEAPTILRVKAELGNRGSTTTISKYVKQYKTERDSGSYKGPKPQAAAPKAQPKPQAQTKPAAQAKPKAQAKPPARPKPKVPVPVSEQPEVVVIIEPEAPKSKSNHKVQEVIVTFDPEPTKPADAPAATKEQSQQRDRDQQQNRRHHNDRNNNDRNNNDRNNNDRNNQDRNRQDRNHRHNDNTDGRQNNRFNKHRNQNQHQHQGQGQSQNQNQGQGQNQNRNGRNNNNNNQNRHKQQRHQNHYMNPEPLEPIHVSPYDQFEQEVIVSENLETMSENELTIKIRKLEAMINKEQCRTEAAEKMAREAKEYAETIKVQVASRIADVKEAMTETVSLLRTESETIQQNADRDLKYYREQLDKANAKIVSLKSDQS